MKVTSKEALIRGRRAQQSGRLDVAKRIYAAILDSDSNSPEANHGMGATLVSGGSPSKALPFLRKALEAKPIKATYWTEYIQTLIQLEKYDEASSCITALINRGVKRLELQQLREKIANRKALMSEAAFSRGVPDEKGFNQDPPSQIIGSVNELYNQQEYQNALVKATDYLVDYPCSALLQRVKGLAHMGLKEIDMALECFRETLKLNPEFPDAYIDLGNALTLQGKSEEALVSYSQALRVKPGFAHAHNNIGLILTLRNDTSGAIESFRLAIASDPELIQPYENVCDLLKGKVFKEQSPKLLALVTALLKKNTAAKVKDWAPAAISLIKLRPSMKSFLEREAQNSNALPLKEKISALTEDPALVLLMSRCPIQDIELENMLRRLRLQLLSAASKADFPPVFLAFTTALARQCFYNEYLYGETTEERKELALLEDRIVGNFAKGTQPRAQEILCVASYGALYNYEWAGLLVPSTTIDEVFRLQILEPQLEKKLGREIKCLAETSDSVSLRVKAQYEQNPYPRWDNLGLISSPKPIRELFEILGIRFKNTEPITNTSPEILVAGCGTGQHSITVLSRIKDSKVVAVDLSLPSLAFAKRKSDELGLTDLEYMQTDILNLKRLGRMFDIIECSGVLHHMDDPTAGWAALKECLKPGGVMKIGLYSKLGREHITKIRAEIDELGYSHDDQQMRSFRDYITRSDKTWHKKIMSSYDFYSMSTLRDLLFHVQEHQFTLPQINNSLNRLGLTFSGFENARAIKSFQSQYNDPGARFDLDKWNDFEHEHPDTFTGMYQFWCQKP